MSTPSRGLLGFSRDDRHWDQYLVGALATANAFGPEWAYGRRNALHGEAGAEQGHAVMETVVIEALSLATVTLPETLEPEQVAILVDAGERLWSVFDHIAHDRIDEGVAVLNAMLESAQAYPTLFRHGPADNWHLHFSPRWSGLGRRWASDFAIATAVLLGGVDYVRVRGCAADRCDRVFYDGTRNASRTYCTERCQSRMKTAARRQRQRAAAESAMAANDTEERDT